MANKSALALFKDYVLSWLQDINIFVSISFNNSYNYIRPNINSSGVYYYELISKNETTRGKLIKN